MSYTKLNLILGNCLFPNHDQLEPDKKNLFFMAEDHGLCDHYKYHKHKIILILSAMRSHRDKIAKDHDIQYYELSEKNKNLTFEGKLLKTVREHKIREIITYDIENHFFRVRIENLCNDNDLTLNILDSPGFLTTHKEFEDYKKSYDRLFMNHFYIWQRKRLKILVTEDESPENGKWSFDQENRKRLPKDIKIPKMPEVKKSYHTKDVSNLVQKLFKDNPGKVETFFLPTTREKALGWMNDFFENRFSNFGPYQDALSKNNEYNFHSLLSPLMNIGLLTPNEVVDKALDFYKNNDVPFQSLEGFIRQIIGWREFVRGVYNTVDLKKNFFNHKNKLTDKWYKGTTGIPPLDNVIKRVVKNAYCHHIERLMVVSNLMFLCEIHPDEVNRWFSELFVDSSDWVMEPNVYGMGQFADGGSFSTKPYISGSNYILKMSDYKKGDWCNTWDGLYWRFVYKNTEFFKENNRMAMMVGMLDKMDKNRKKKIIKIAEEFIEEVTC